ncbi:MAG: metallophosphoesterase [Ignavibacteriales bacterium]|nr:metallophosphoesterase [Ignavibacteriales bacterium]
MNFLIFFLIFLAILGLGYGYIGWRLIAPSHLTEPWNTISWVALVTLFLIPPIGFFFQFNRIEAWWTNILSWISFLSMGFVSLLFTLLVVRDLALLTSLGVEKIIAFGRQFFEAGGRAALEADPQRREFLLQATNVAVLGAAGILTGYGLYEARRRPGVVEISVPIKNLPPSLEGFRILQFTDIHAGLTVKRPFVETVAEQVSELKADLIAFTGDLVDGTVPYLRDHVDPLRHLSAPFGRFFVTGNHEYYSGAKPWIEEADRMGFTVLVNQHRVISRGGGRILLAGVTDFSAGDFVPGQASNPAEAIDGAPASDVKILLAHQPRSIYAAAPFGFDLQISGHTHGGQFFPWNILAAVGQPYISGLHRHNDTWVYVSRGTGYWGPPVRLAARSEITILTLTRQNDVPASS